MPTRDHAAKPVVRAAVPSPCVNVCRMDEAGQWCEGCLRSIDEISAWSQLDDVSKRTILRLLPTRRAERRLHLASLAVPPAPPA